MTELILSVKKEVNSRITEIGSLGLAIVYTVGHIIIAWACATLIFNASFSLAAADAIIEPIINGFWFYFLLLWRIRESDSQCCRNYRSFNHGDPNGAAFVRKIWM